MNTIVSRRATHAGLRTRRALHQQLRARAAFEPIGNRVDEFAQMRDALRAPTPSQLDRFLDRIGAAIDRLTDRLPATDAAERAVGWIAGAGLPAALALLVAGWV